MATDLLSALVEFEAAARAAGLGEEHFAAGLDPDHIRGVLAGHGLHPHPDLVTLYSWHDGYPLSLGRPYRWLYLTNVEGLEGAERLYFGNLEAADLYPGVDRFWPIASLDWGTLMVHDETGVVWELNEDEGLRPIVPAATLLTVVEHWTQLHRDRYAALDGDGRWVPVDPTVGDVATATASLRSWV